MKWEKPNGPIQHTSDGRYAVVEVNNQHWVAYLFGAFATADELGTQPTDSDARALCESHETHLLRRRA